MNFNSTLLADVYLIDVNPFQDERGFFMRTFCKDEFQQIGHTKEFVQFNHSINPKKGTLRGMHFQVSPYGEVKLIRCIAGSVFDVVVDIRQHSSTYLQWFGAELSSDNRRMMYVPEGCAHGFLTLSDSAELLYHHTSYYNPMADRGVRYNDPTFHIEWPISIEVVSEKDMNYPLIDDTFEGYPL